MARAVLEVRDLWVGDGPGAAVQGVSFQVGRGQVLGVLGGPGAGKSRLLRCVGLDYSPTSGAVFLHGEEVSGATGDKRRQLRSGSIELVHPPAPTGERDETVPGGPAGLLLVGSRTATVPVAGMRQRIQMARALTTGASVLLLDEPIAGVDSAVSERIRELLDRLRAEAGTAVVIASRDPHMLGALADSVLVLEDGKLVQHGPTATIIDSRSARLPAPMGGRRSA